MNVLLALPCINLISLIFLSSLNPFVPKIDISLPRYMKEGEKSRKVGSTNMNERSSRSHTIFRLRIESSNRVSDDETMTEEEDEGEQIMASQLNLVDLAGSERAAQTGAGGARLKEGCNINQVRSLPHLYAWLTLVI